MAHYLGQYHSLHYDDSLSYMETPREKIKNCPIQLLGILEYIYNGIFYKTEVIIGFIPDSLRCGWCHFEDDQISISMENK